MKSNQRKAMFARLKRGDKVMLRENVLQRHSKSVPIGLSKSDLIKVNNQMKKNNKMKHSHKWVYYDGFAGYDSLVCEICGIDENDLED